MARKSDESAPFGQQNRHPEPRYNEQGRLLCRAKRANSDQMCGNPALAGGRVCRFHGGAAPQVKRKAQLRLQELVAPAISTLAKEMVEAEKSADRQRAANSILDRAGISRVQKIDGSDARELLKQRLLAIQEQKRKELEAIEEAERAAEEKLYEEAEIIDE